MPELRPFLFSLFLASSTVAHAENDFFIEPFVAYGNGSTWYRLQVTEPLENPPAGYDVSVGQSELEYPLDVALAGLKTGRVFATGRGKHVSVYARAWSNLSDPISKMEDTDWVGVKNNTTTSLYKFSYTQSRSEVEWVGAEVGLEMGDYRLFKRRVAYGIALQADYSSHKMFGVTGWQKLPDTSRILIDDLHNELVLTYRLFYVEPRIYTNITMVQSSNWNWHMLLSISPFVVANDHDDHVLRNKRSETWAFGGGAGLESQLEFLLNKHVSLIADVRIRYIFTKGKMNQKYYGDDPGTNDVNESGLEFHDIDNLISLFTQQVGLGLRWSF